MAMRFPLKVLLVDDDGNIRRTLALTFKDLGCSVEQASSVEEAVVKLEKCHFDLILTDYKMETQNGLHLIKQAKRLSPETITIVMTAFASFENAVEVVKEGAFDYLPKPFTNAQLAHLLTKVRSIVQLRHENLDLRKGKHRKDFFAGFTSKASLNLEEFVQKIAPTDATVLLTGESGTGKSELAKLIHEQSPRSGRPFVTVYCTTLTESLLEAELFGHVRGAFTGAVQDKIGKLESADGGTLFLDEVGDLSPNGQAKLLRFLQEKVFERIGENKEISINARVIAATHRDLNQEVAQGKFREDLYYRLNVLECQVSPLRDRKEDLPVLIERIAHEIGSNRGLVDFRIPLGSVLDALLDYSWPGNIRELRNLIERLVMLARGGKVSLSDLPEAIQKGRQIFSKPGAKLLSLQELEKQHIQQVLSKTTSLEEAAGTLGITTVTLWRKRKDLGLS